MKKSHRSPHLVKFGTSTVLMLLFMAFTKFSAIAQQELSREEFQDVLIKAIEKNNNIFADSLISHNRLRIKPFVNSLITDCILNELYRKPRESKRLQTVAEKTAGSFQKIFGEKSLSIGVNYLTIWSRAQKEEKLKADSLCKLGTTIRLEGEDPFTPEKLMQAKEKLKEALDAYTAIGDERGEAEVLGGIGAIYYDVNDPENALSYYYMALEKRTKVDDRQLMGSTLNGIGSVNRIMLKNFPDAITYYSKAEMLRSDIGDISGLRTSSKYKAGAFLEWGEVLTDKGDYNDAFEKYKKSLEIQSNLGNKSGVADALSHIGFVYSRTGNLQEALRQLTEADKIASDANDSIVIAGIYNNLGVTMQDAGRTEKALNYYLSALNIYRRNNRMENVLPLYNNLGTLYFDLKDYPKAENIHLEGLQLCREMNNKDQEVGLLLNLANDRILLGKFDLARSDYQSAYTLARDFNSTELIWKIFAGKAETYEKEGDFNNVIQLNDSALKIIGNMRDNLTDNDLKASYLASERYAYEDIIDLLTNLYEKDRTKGYDMLAFRYAEQCKSRVLLDVLRQSDLQKKHVEKLQKSATDETADFNQSVSLPELQKICPDKNTLILEYLVGDSSSSLWAITGSAHELYRLPGKSVLKEQIETIRFALQSPDKKMNDFFTNSARLLYNELIKPAEPLLTKKSKIIVIPDGLLNYLPFEVLLTESSNSGKSGTYSDLPFLIKKYPVTYAQSASVLNELIYTKPDREKSKNGKLLFAIGDPVYEDTLNNKKTEVSRLIYSSDEIRDIVSFFDPESVTSLLREDATEDNIKKTADLDQYKYLHFATHGFVDENNPDRSALVLTALKSSEEDGLLTAPEIFNMKLNASLVALSACQTGLGKLVQGEGIIGLTRAFMYAGTPSVLVSLWSVSDRSTADLMKEFYKNLIRNRQNKADALRNAQLTLIRDPELAHPFYWAPFILVGDWR